MKNLMLAGLLFRGVLLSQSQPPVSLTLEKAVEVAFSNNPAIAESEGNLGVAEARVRQARAAYRPSLGFSGLAKAGLSGALNLLMPIGLSNSPLFRNYAAGVFGDVTVFDFGQRRHAVQVEENRRTAAEADLERMKLGTALSARLAYIEVLRSQRLESVAAEVVKAQQSTVRQAQAFYEARLRSRVELELAKAALSGAELREIEARNNAEIARAGLRRALGFSEEVSFALADTLTDVPNLSSAGSAVSEALAARPEVQSIAAYIRAAEERVQVARSQRRPSFAIGSTAGYARINPSKLSNQSAAGLGIDFPLYAGGRITAEVEEAEAELLAAKARQRQIDIQIGYEVRRAVALLESAVASLPAVQARRVASQHAARLASERYREKLGSIIEVTQAQAALAEATAAESVARYDLRRAEAQLNATLGRR